MFKVNNKDTTTTPMASDHLQQFLLAPEFFSNSTPTKYSIMSHDREKSNELSFFSDYGNINWNKVLQISKNNVNLTFDNYLNTMYYSIFTCLITKV